MSIWLCSGPTPPGCKLAFQDYLLHCQFLWLCVSVAVTLTGLVPTYTRSLLSLLMCYICFLSLSLQHTIRLFYLYCLAE